MTNLTTRVLALFASAAFLATVAGCRYNTPETSGSQDPYDSGKSTEEYLRDDYDACDDSLYMPGLDSLPNDRPLHMVRKGEEGLEVDRVQPGLTSANNGGVLTFSTDSTHYTGLLSSGDDVYSAGDCNAVADTTPE